MLVKVTAKNQLTLPKRITAAVGATEYFEVEAREGRIILTPVRIQRADAVRAKLADLDPNEKDIAKAVAWVRRPARKMSTPARK
ncbi:MAG: AbrB/MazE/SpoVT family DNA-binding domain-containing protein [Deltaproteobacteria bacterium]|nr:AbrB/MazE/SpoVT family DNA-binding domain-containing protein [Deltaproteobacteria bacterium]MBI3388336.1 AbrB/MazE/SpoVT family DNA-binding domain-containing protein [Deltaproteobacteria bacterium]